MPHILIFFNISLQNNAPVPAPFHISPGKPGGAPGRRPGNPGQVAPRRIKKGAGFFTKPAPGYCGKIIENSIE